MYFFYFGLLLLLGLLFGKLAKKVKLPNVTGYLVAGLIAGPILGLFDIHVIPEDVIKELSIFSSFALGFIAFAIGTDFRISYFKRVGTKTLVIAIFESLGAILVVLAGLLIFGVDLKFAMVLSAIAAATAPAATVMVIKQYKAKGEVTENLISVVAIDDATAIMLFGIFVAISSSIGVENSNLAMAIIKPFLEIIASLGLGFILGIILSLLLKWFTGRSNRISVIVSIVLIAISLTEITKLVIPGFEISALLLCMMMGSVFTNTTNQETSNKILELVDRFTPPLLIFFFVISGADLNITVLTTVGLIGVIYIVFRVIGKVSGAYVGSVISKSSKKVSKYLGWGLVPQAGVAIGLTVVASSILPADQASQIRAVVLSATFVYELMGPLITKTMLVKAGEITQV